MVAVALCGVALASSARTPPPHPAASIPSAPYAAIDDGSDADVQTVVKLEMASLEWERLNDVDEMAAHIAEDWIGVPDGRVMTRVQLLEDVKTMTVGSYKVADVMTRRLAQDVVLVTYRMEQDGHQADGSKWEPLVRATAIWAKRQGKWVGVFYQETVLPGGDSHEQR
jgi:hypothetical protein